MNELKIFTNDAFGSVRVVEQDGQPWFVARDVCAILGFDEAHTNMAVKGLDDDEKSTSIKMVGRHDFNGLRKDAPLVSEPGLYSLILRSNKTEAKAFKRWITHEVLPTIRKTGSYVAPAAALPTDYATALRALADSVEQKQLAETQRDHAVLTKAEIGSRREATSMATASVAVRKVSTLEDQLGDGKRFKMVKAIPWLFEMFINSKGMYSVVGKCLKRLSDDLGYQIKKIPCPDYPDGVNAYHVEVVDVFRRELQENPGILEKYRIFEGEAEAV